VEKLQLLRTEQDNERVLAEVWQLMEKGEKNLTPVITRGCGAQEESNTSLESAFSDSQEKLTVIEKTRRRALAMQGQQAPRRLYPLTGTRWESPSG
jgi:hypothetical protein